MVSYRPRNCCGMPLPPEARYAQKPILEETMISRRLALSLGLGMLMLTGPASAQSVLDFPNWQAEEPGVSTWWKDLIAAYEQRNPGVTVKIQQIPFAQYVRQLTVRFAAGSPPNILHL
ncbi:MAG: extracellular solute-binding protein, partial [Alphaproteobacteria bacterium]|nr:extracellular solute-binding protein [Alphaproteobacteria bacterium]